MPGGQRGQEAAPSGCSHSAVPGGSSWASCKAVSTIAGTHDQFTQFQFPILSGEAIFSFFFARIKQISLLNYLCIICRLELLNDEAQDIEFIFIEPAVQFDLELRIYLDHVI